MESPLEVAAKALLSGLGLLVLGLGARSVVWRSRAERATPWLAVLAVGGYVNFGALHGGGLFPHYWEQFHYFLGSKYFAELGYDGLYVASMGAEMQAFPGRSFQPFLRDLRTNQVVATAGLEAHGYEVHRRFSPERWEEFKRDNAFFVGLDPAYLAKVRQDHGYNPSPAWTFVARLAAGRLPAGQATLALLGALDFLLLSGAFLLWFRTYGAGAGALALLVYGTGYAWRFYWVGGAFLRQDWLAASLVALCLLRRRRFGLAGALLGYASMVRVFPALLLAGLVAQAIRDAARRRDTRWAARLAAGFLLAAALLLAAGAATGRGAAAWPEFAANLRKHQATWLTNNVGLKNTLLYGPDTLARRLVDWRLPEPWTAWQERMAALEDERRWLILAAGGALTLLALRSALREGPDGAAAASLALAFAFATPTCYYWGALVLTLARRPRATAGALLVLNLALCAAHLATPVFEARYGLMSWGLLLFFVWWLPEEGLYRRILSRGSRPPLAAGGLLC